MHRDQTPKLRLDLFDHRRRAACHHRDSRPVALVVDLGHGQAFDVVAPSRKQADHAGQNARFVVDEHGKRMGLDRFGMRVAQVIGRMA